MIIDPKDKLFCEIGADLGFLREEQITSALEAQRVDRAVGTQKPIGSYLHEQGILSKEQISQIVKMQDKMDASTGRNLVPASSQQLSPTPGSLQCYLHPGNGSIGTCVGCGKFICADCNTAIKGKNYCKACVSEKLSEVEKKVERLEDRSGNPMVFMNAGGGGASSSSSSSAVAASAARDSEREIELALTKSRQAAALLAIFLGTIGLHKFYLGKWVQGILYLVFAPTGFPTIFGLLEGIGYLLKDDRAFEIDIVRDGQIRVIR